MYNGRMNPFLNLLNLIIAFFETILNLLKTFIDAIINLLNGLLQIFHSMFGG